jgi:RNA polymerase sigma-70 factor (ECF subfamily)
MRSNPHVISSEGTIPDHEVSDREPKGPSDQVQAMGSSDAEVIEASWSNPEAFGAIFDRHLQAIYGFCVRRVGTGVAEDLAGETFLRAFHARSRFDISQTSALPWLFGIARNVVREQVRTVAHRERGLERLHTQAGISPTDSASLAADAREDLDAIARALLDLPEDEVETLLLHVWEGLSYAECALALGIPIGTVRSRINRIRRRLREHLSQGSTGERAATEPSILPLRLLGGSHERPT